MNFEITGKNGLEITPALKDFVSDKLKKVDRHVASIQSIRIALAVDRALHTAEATIHLSGKDIHVQAHHDQDMYVAIGYMIDKLDYQVVRHKEKTMN